MHRVRSTASLMAIGVTLAWTGVALASTGLAPYQKGVDAGFANLNLKKWRGPTTRALAPKKVNLVIVECNATLGGCVRPAKAAAAAARKLGWSVKLLNGEGQSQRFNELIQSAVAGGATAIMTDGIDPHLAAAGLADARSKGIPVVSLSEGSKPSPEGFNIDVSGNTTRAGQLLGDYVVSQSSGTATILPMADNEYVTAEHEVAGFLSVVKDCKSCTVESTMNFISADVSTTLRGRLISYLRTHPKVNWINSPYDPAVTGAICPAIQAAGLAGKVHVVSMLGLPPNLALVKKDSCEVADATWPQAWNGWAGVDQLIRILDHKPTFKPADENLPIVLLNHNHLPPKMNYEGGHVHYEAKYLSLWTEK